MAIKWPKMAQMTPFLDQWCIPMVSIKFQKKIENARKSAIFWPENHHFRWFDVAIFNRRFSERNPYSSWENGPIDLILFLKRSLGCPPQSYIATFFYFVPNFSKKCIFWTPAVNFWLFLPKTATNLKCVTYHPYHKFCSIFHQLFMLSNLLTF